MTLITIDVKNKKDLAKAKAIAKENGWEIKEPVKKSLPPKNGKKLAELLDEMASKGGPSSFPANATLWQKKTRTDKSLSGRQ